MVTKNYSRIHDYIRVTAIPRIAKYIVYSHGEGDENDTSGINYWEHAELFPDPDNESDRAYYYWSKKLKMPSYPTYADKTGRNVWIEALFTYFVLSSFIIIGIILIVLLWDNWTARRRSNNSDFIKLTVPGRTFYGRYNHGILGRYARLTKLTDHLRSQLKTIIRVRLVWESIVVIANHLLMFKIFWQEAGYVINADECYDIFKLWLGDYFYGIPTMDWHRCLKSVRSFFEWPEVRKHFDTAIIHTKSFMKKFPAVKTYELDIYPDISELILGIMFEVATGVRLDKKRHGSDRKYMSSVKDLHEIISRRMFDPWWRFKWFSRDRRRERECCDNIYKKLSKLYIAEMNNMDLAGPEDKKNILEHILNSDICQRVPEECVKNMIEFTVFNGHETLTTIICFVLQALAWNEDLQDAVYADQRTIFIADLEDDILQDINPENVDPDNFEEELARDPTETHFGHVSELDKIIFECLRAFPPFPILYKEVTQRFAWINRSPVKQNEPEPVEPVFGTPTQQEVGIQVNQDAIVQATQAGEEQGRQGEERQGEARGEAGIQPQLQNTSSSEKRLEANTKIWLHIYAHHRISGKDGFDRDNCLNPFRRSVPEFVFGDGKRKCPGMTFALFVIRIVVTYILSRFQIVKVIDEKDIKLVAETVLRADGGHPIKLVPRTMSTNNKWKKKLTELKKKYGIYEPTEWDKKMDAKYKEVEQKLEMLEKMKKNKRQSSPQPGPSRQQDHEASPEERRQEDDAVSCEEEIRSPQSVQSASTSREGMPLEFRLRNRRQRNSPESDLTDSTPKGKSKKGKRGKRR